MISCKIQLSQIHNSCCLEIWLFPRSR